MSEGKESMAQKAYAWVPEGVKPVLESGAEWIKDHPKEAAIMGMVGGFIVGYAGIARVAMGIQALSSIPAVSKFATDLMHSLGNSGADKNSDAVH
jgi:hypothetical protein